MAVLAIAVKGKEYLYNASTAHLVSNASADFIRDALNAAKYKLKENEVWHKYDRLDYTSTAWDYASHQKFARYKNRIRVVRR